MKRFIFAGCCFALAAGPVLAAAAQDSLAGLIEAGNRKAALEKIREGADVNAAQPDGTTPLHWAIYHVDYDLLQALLDKKANPNVTNAFGSAPIAEAVALADTRMVKMLLDHGAGPEGANQDGETALMLAIKTGDLEIARMLVNAGANVNTIEKFHGQTPLMYAAAAPKNAAEIVKLLLAKGADVKPRAMYSDWPSQITSEPRAQYRPVGGLTALLYAARDGCYACTEELIAAGADVNRPTPEGVTPLMIALDNEHNDVAKLLLDHGANPHVWDWWGRTALYIAIDRKEAAAGGGRGGLGLLGGAARGGRGRGSAVGPEVVPSHGPAVSGMEIVNALLDAGVDVNAQLNMHRPSRGGNSGRFSEEQLSTGATPLFRATQGDDMPVIQALLAKGADPNIDAMGFTPFLLAAGVTPGGRGGGNGVANRALMDLMIQHGADVNAQVTGTRTYSMRISYHPPPDKEGMSPLHAAAESGRLETVRYLLEKGANPELVDANGKKPVDVIGKGEPGAGGPGGPAAGGRGQAPAGGARGAEAGSAAGQAPAAGAGTAGRGAAGRGTGGGRGGAGGRGGFGPPRASAADLAEIRTLLENAAAKQ